MAEYVLHCFAQSGNAYKPALMLELAGADWEPRFVDFMNGATRTTEYRESLNIMGEVPVLEHDGQKLTQSGVILDYLADRLGRFGGRDEAEKREIWRWILFDNHKLTAYTATLRFLRNFARTGETPVTEFLHGRSIAAYKVLEAHLQGRDFVVGEQPTIADLSLCGYLFWPDEIGIDFAPYANIRGWLDRISALPGWKAPYELMPGHPLPGRG